MQNEPFSTIFKRFSQKCLRFGLRVQGGLGTTITKKTVKNEQKPISQIMRLCFVTKI